MSANGGNSSTENLKEKTTKAFSPAAVDFSTDLHSMGQWIQEGERIIFETVISIEKPACHLEIPSDEENLDGLNFLAGKRVDEVNKMAELGYPTGPCGWRSAQHARHRPGTQRILLRTAHLLLRKSLRHQRLHPRREPV